jgi:foldase protein PrsA
MREKMRRNNKAAIMIFTVFMCAVMILSACGSKNSVAATYAGGKVNESTVTDRIEAVRNGSPDYKSDEGWATILKNSGLTPETYRKQVIEDIIKDELVVEAAKKEDLKADTETIDTNIKQMKDSGSLEQTMNSFGVKSEDDLKKAFEAQDLRAKLLEKLYPAKKLTDKELEEFVVQNAATYAGKRSSEILLTPEGGKDIAALTKEAADLKKKIKTAADFAKYAKEYSKDTSSAEKGGDKGWSYQNSFSAEYQTALDKLKVGAVSDPVETNNTVVLIMCTDEYSLPKDGKVDYKKVPKDIIEALSQRGSEQNRNTEFSQYVAKLIEKADIKINDMPKKLSYDVDMKLAKSPDASAEPQQEKKK